MAAIMLDNLLNDLKAREEGTERVTFRLGDMAFYNEQGVKKLDGNEFSGDLSDKGFAGLCKKLGIPALYAKRCGSQLQEANVNAWLERKRNNQYAALIQDGKIRSFMDSEYPYVSTAAVVESVIDLVPDDFSVGNYHLDDEVLEAVILTPEFDQHVVDSPIFGGLRIVHSDSWNTFPRFDSYLWRQICSNGMTSPIAHKKFRVSGKSQEEVLNQVRGFVKQSLEQLPEMFKGFEKLYEQEVVNFQAVVAKICLENKLPKKIKDILVETAGTQEFLITIMGERIDNMLNIANLLTFVGTHNHEISQDHRDHLMSIAGNLSLTGSSRCGSCGGSVS